MRPWTLPEPTTHRHVGSLAPPPPPTHTTTHPPTHPADTGGRAATAARRRHVLYLFHPVQPFLMVVCQDADSGTAEQLTLFTRL